jgi:hypothetical protein
MGIGRLTWSLKGRPVPVEDSPIVYRAHRDTLEGGWHGREYRLMSSGGHLELPPERWMHRVPEQYRDPAPRTMHLPDGGDALLIEGQPLLEANFLDLRRSGGQGTEVTEILGITAVLPPMERRSGRSRQRYVHPRIIGDRRPNRHPQTVGHALTTHRGLVPQECDGCP